MIKRRQAIYQHDLPVEAAEMLFVKAFHDLLAIVAIAFAQHPDVAAFIGLGQLPFLPVLALRPGEKLQRRSAGHLAGEHKTARLDKMQPSGFSAHQIVGVVLGDGRQHPLVGRRSVKATAQPRLPAPPVAKLTFAATS